MFAIADHDNLAAYRELTAPGADPLPDGLDLVPAVEINAVTRDLDLDLPEGELHVLGIGVDPSDDAFEAAIAAQRGARRLRFTATVVRLRDIGVPVDAHLPEGVMESDDALGRPTLARALVAAGHAESVEDAFRRILGHGLPGVRAADRHGTRRGHPGDPRRGRPRVDRPLRGGARSGCRSCAS